MPQDVRLAPDGRYLLAADMLRNGVWVIDARTFRYVRLYAPASAPTASTLPYSLGHTGNMG